MANPKRNLRWLGNQWGIRLRYPKALSEHLAKDWYTAKTDTSDLREAQLIRDSVENELRKQAKDLEDAERRSRFEQEALLIEQLRQLRKKSEEATDKIGRHYGHMSKTVWGPLVAKDPDVGAYDALADELQERAEELEKQDPGSGLAWFAKVTNPSTRTEQYVDRWCSEKQVTEQAEKARRYAVRRFAEWAEMPAEQVTPKVAGSYIEHLVSTGLSGSTVNQYIAKLGGYWRFMRQRGLVNTENPFDGQSVQLRDKQPRLEWTPREIRFLIKKAQSKRLRDAILIATYSGMRPDEVARLTGSACMGDMFDIREGSTSAAVFEWPVPLQRYHPNRANPAISNLG